MMSLAKQAGMPGFKSNEPQKGKSTPANAAKQAGAIRGGGNPRGRGRGRGQARVSTVYEEECDTDPTYEELYEGEEYPGEEDQDPLN